jgi:hypothetical protein
MRIFCACCLVHVLGCGGGSSAHTTPDAAAGGGPACTGAVYDPCTTNDQCMSMNCHFYMMSNFTICTQACTPGDNTTCPVDATGTHGTCNNMGNCKPTAANNCTR